MDRELSEKYLRRVKHKRNLIIASIVIGIILVFWGFRNLITPTLDRTRIRTAIAEMGDVESTLNASGTIVPEFEQLIISPINTKVLSVKLREGDHVKKGESILGLYLVNIQNEYNQVKDEYNLKLNEVEKQKLARSREINELQSQYDVNLLQVKFLESSLEREKKLFDIGTSSLATVEQAELSLQIARRELQLRLQQIGNKKKTFAAGLKELEIEVRIKKRLLEELETRIEEANVKSKNDGVITFVKDDIGSSITAGEVIAKVANLNSYKLEAQISDIYATQLATGGKIKLRTNNNDLTGIIRSISPGISTGVVNFTATLDNNSNTNLRPNLRAEVFVVTGSSDNVVRVKNGPFFNSSSRQRVYVVKGNTAYGMDTKFGASNFDFVEIKEGVQPGDEVIISDMEEYYHMDEIEIN